MCEYPIRFREILWLVFAQCPGRTAMTASPDVVRQAADEFLDAARVAAKAKSNVVQLWTVLANVDGVDMEFTVECRATVSCRFAEMANRGVDTENPQHLWAAGFRDGTSVTITGNSHELRMKLEQLL